MNYAIKNIHVKSSWFDTNVKQNKYKKIGAEAFYLYLSMFKFYVANQQTKYTFFTSVEQLRKVVGCDNKHVLELLKVLVKHKVIKLNVDRWDRMIDKNTNRVLDQRLLIIEAIDVPITIRVKDGDDTYKDKPAGDDDHFININFELFDNYLKMGLSIKCFGLYCLINKHSNNGEGKCWVTVNKMAESLGMSDSTIMTLIKQMNKHKLLYSYKKQLNGDKNITAYEHKILSNWSRRDKWLEIFGNDIDKTLKMWSKQSKIKEAI